MKIKFLTTIFLVSPLWGYAQYYIPVTDYDESPKDIFYQEDKYAAPIDRETNNRYLGGDGWPRRQTVVLDDLHYEVDLSNFVDWDLLFALNLQAQDISLRLINCLHGRSGVREVYWNFEKQRNLCPDVSEELLAWKLQVYNFYQSSRVRDVTFNQIIKCPLSAHRSEILCAKPSYNKERRLTWVKGKLYSTKKFLSTDFPERAVKKSELEDLFRLFSLIDPVSLQPLFVQVSLEILALGYPLPYGTYSCKGLDCLFEPTKIFFDRKIVLGHKGSRLAPWGYEPSWGTRFVEQDRIRMADDMVNGNQIEDESQRREGQLSEGVRVRKDILSTGQLRSSFAASKFLFIFGLMTDKPSIWGLWPQASYDLVSTLAQTRFLDYSGLSLTDDLTDWTLLTMSRQFEEAASPKWITFGQTSGVDALARVGGWRKLWAIEER